MIFVGVDWSEQHHEVEVQSESGKKLKAFRVSADLAGLSRFHETIASLAEEPSQVVIGIEANHGLWVNALVASGYLIYPINPLTSARNREGDSPAGSKSDRGDARMLATLVRTKRHSLRALAGDSVQAQAIQIRARSHVRAIRLQQRLRNQLRSSLLKCFTGLLPLFADEREDFRDALAVLSVAPNPERARHLSLSKLEAVLRRHGRQRRVAATAAKIQALLREPQLELESAKLVSAYSDEVRYLVRTLLQVRSEIAQLEQQLTVDFREHPDAEIYLSLPGLADVLGARVLGESGDDPTRYPNARSRKNYVGNSPVTKASGRSRQVQRRIARNRLLADASFRWAACALNASPGARRYYEQLRARDKSHTVAVRALANKLIGILHFCLRERCLYEEGNVWPLHLHEDAA